MDFIGLLTGSENLYKYSFVGGLGLIILCLFYPLNKRYELACNKDLNNKEIRLINLDIDELNDNVRKLNTNFDTYTEAINNANSDKEKQKIKDSVNNKFNIILGKRKQISIKNAEIAYNKDRIATLSKNIDDLEKYETYFWRSGWFLTLFGFVGWFLLMLKKHNEKPNP